MKQLDSTSTDELDAGWDASDLENRIILSGSPVSQPPVSGTAEPIDEEIDAGWDLEPTDAPARQTTKPETIGSDNARQQRQSEIQFRSKSGATARPAAEQPTATSAPPPHQLTKKERRRIEREQRIHAAKKQAQAKSEKRSQRKRASDPVTLRPTSAPSTPPASSISGPKKRHRKTQARRKSGPLPESDSRAIRHAVSATTQVRGGADSPRKVAQEHGAAHASSARAIPPLGYLSIGLLALLALGLLYLLLIRH